MRQARRSLRPHLHRRLQRGGRGGRRARARGGRGGAPLRHPRLRPQHQHQRLRGPPRAAPAARRAHRARDPERAPGPPARAGDRVRRGLQPLGADGQRARPRSGRLHRVLRLRRRHRRHRRLLRGVQGPAPSCGAPSRPPTPRASRWWRSRWGAPRRGRAWPARTPGHLAGSDAVVEGLFAQYGVVRVRDLDELLETAALFAKLPAGTGGRCCLYSISGGSGTLMAEVAESSGVPVPVLSRADPGRAARDDPRLPHRRQPRRQRRPVPRARARSRTESASSTSSPPIPNIDVIVIGLTGALGRLTDRFAEDIVAFIDEVKKPIVVTWNSFKTDEQGFTTLVDAGVPDVPVVPQLLRRPARLRPLPGGVVGVPPPQADARPPPARRRRPHSPRPAARGRAPPSVPTPRGDCSSPSASPWPGRAWPTPRPRRPAWPADIGFPVVMKIASPDFPHKSDAGLVRLSVGSAPEAKAVYTELVRARHAGQARGPHRGRPDPAADRGGHRDDRGGHPRPGVRARRARGHGRGVRRDPEGRGGAAPAPRPARRPGDGEGPARLPAADRARGRRRAAT